MKDGSCDGPKRKPCRLSTESGFTDCVRHETFLCPRCERVVQWDFGCDDEAPALCDDCWAAYFGSNDQRVFGSETREGEGS